MLGLGLGRVQTKLAKVQESSLVRFRIVRVSNYFADSQSLDCRQCGFQAKHLAGFLQVFLHLGMMEFDLVKGDSLHIGLAFRLHVLHEFDCKDVNLDGLAVLRVVVVLRLPIRMSLS